MHGRDIYLVKMRERTRLRYFFLPAAGAEFDALGVMTDVVFVWEGALEAPPDVAGAVRGLAAVAVAGAAAAFAAFGGFDVVAVVVVVALAADVDVDALADLGARSGFMPPGPS